MTSLINITKEIVDLHDFFTAWFNGSAKYDALETDFLSYLHEDILFIPPEGHALTAPMIRAGFEKGYATNINFKTEIRDIQIRHHYDKMALVTFTEWQTGAVQSAQSNNARITTALIEAGDTIKWRHIQETWLPEEIRAAGSFDF